ncbi:hypothetical protein L3V79_09365 [Thiotrichales bacterium 19S9-12]|nr:hypothetical protein [Thiotrichales bacterium 19S9-11]MCF6812566.1 hypothetical protein [Thiotrichales bacterium 19S9-12]
MSKVKDIRDLDLTNLSNKDMELFSLYFEKYLAEKNQQAKNSHLTAVLNIFKGFKNEQDAKAKAKQLKEEQDEKEKDNQSGLFVNKPKNQETKKNLEPQKV